MTGLGQSPVVDPVALDGMFTAVERAKSSRGGPLVRRLAAGPRPSPGDLGPSVRASRRRIDAFGSIVDPANVVHAALAEQLLVAESIDLRPGRRWSSYIDGVDHAVTAQLRRIQLPRARSITLTARDGAIPITVRNDTTFPVHVVAHVESEKLLFPHGATRRLDLAPKHNTTERFDVSTRASGAFPMRIALESLDGNLTVGRTRFTVRSTSTSGVGLAISGGAALFLALWWARHLVKGRRARRLVPASALRERAPWTEPRPGSGGRRRAWPRARCCPA